MRSTLALAAALVVAAPLAASAQGYYGPRPIQRDIDATGSVSGRAPWNAPYQYDSGSAMDNQPARPYYQQGGGQQTGGPARNLIPEDGFHLFPR